MSDEIPKAESIHHNLNYSFSQVAQMVVLAMIFPCIFDLNFADFLDFKFITLCSGSMQQLLNDSSFVMIFILSFFLPFVITLLEETVKGKTPWERVQFISAFARLPELNHLK